MYNMPFSNRGSDFKVFQCERIISLVALEIIKHGDQRSVDYLKVNILGE